MAIQFTPVQQKVLDARDHNILVSAAAGSGKTAVLVERIVRLVSEGEHPLDIDRLLVVTFTRAAAAQMRERIGKALAERLALDPSNTHLQRQEVLLHNAQITTMDSFFTFLLRNYFSDIDLDPGFRQIEPTESSMIAAEVLQDFLEEKYAEKDPAFLRCVSYFCPGADDRQLETLILELCEKAGSHPSPQAWLKDRASDYDVPDEEALFSTQWMQSMILRLADLLMETGLSYEAMKELCRKPGGPDVCLAFLEEEKQGLVRQIGTIREQLLHALEKTAADPEDPDARTFVPGLWKKLWEEIQSAVSWQFKRYPSTRGKKYDYMDVSLKEAVKSMRDAEKDRIVKLRDNLGGQTPEVILAMMKGAKEPLQTLSLLAAEYADRFLEVKKERHLIDFVDLEHFALDILAERQEDGTYLPRRAARALRSHYAEILIDEYQDSNEVQELLLQIISGEDEGHNNRFMVGDIKQSIYRFRLARPEIFMEKYDSYRPDDPSTERIDLDQNFRSRAQVLDCVNFLFLRIMRREVGGVDYNESVSLKKGAVFAGEDLIPEEHDPYRAELLLLDTLPAEEEQEDGEKNTGAPAEADFGRTAAAGDKAWPENDEDPGQEEEEDGFVSLSNEIRELSDRQKECLLIAGRIKELVGNLPVRDDGTGELRPARYGDIVILLRSTVGWNEDLRAVFAREGIPAYAESRTGYFAAQEIRDIIEMLRVLDNPRQDIPLYGVLRGYFGGFTQNEIAMIHLAAKDDILYDALCVCAGEPAFPGAAEDKIPADPQGAKDEIPEGAQPAGNESSAGNAAAEELRRKCAEFLAFLRSWRRRVRYCPVSEIVTALLEETGYQDYCTALPAGAQRSANLRFLQSQADAFTKTDFTGLFQFLRYIDGLHRQEIDYGEANTLDENADVVRIMSIHKSKGLEFPVCFVAGLSKGFAFRSFDASGPMLFDGDWGVGIHYFDTVSRVSASTLRREEIAEKIRRDCMGEELRVLYVALTRAKEKLIMTASAKDFTKKLTDWTGSMAGYFSNPHADKLSPSMIAGASSFVQLICKSVLASEGKDFDFAFPDPDSSLPLDIRICTQKDLSMQAVEEQFDLSRCEEILRGMEGRPLHAQPDPEAAQELASWFFRTYPHEELRDLYAQTSVSELKHRAMRTLQFAEEGSTESAAELFPQQAPVPYLPAFLRNEEVKSSADPADLQEIVGAAAEESAQDTAAVRTQDTAEESAQDTAAVRAQDNAEKSLHEAAGANAQAAGMRQADAGAGARRGTAFHRVLELVDYDQRDEWVRDGSAGFEKLQQWLYALTETGKIEREDLELVNISGLIHFLRSPLAERMTRAHSSKKLFREQPFVMGIPADEAGEGLPHNEMITVQGIIDAFFIENEGIVLLDYKTDRVREEGELIARYQTQLDLYAKALGRAFGLPVRQKLIYSTELGRQIEL